MKSSLQKTILHNAETSFVSMGGGANQFSSKYPLLYAMVKNAVSPSQTNENSAFTDLVYIDYVSYEPQQELLNLKIVVSLTEPTSAVMTDVTVTAADGTILATFHHTAFNTSRDSCWYQIENVSADHGSVITTKAHSCWHCKENGTLKEMEVEDSYVLALISNVDKVNIDDPSHKRSPGEGSIYIAYNRYPQVNEVLDYVYPYEISGGGQHLYLDCKGEVELTGQKEFSEIYSKSLLVDSPAGYGVAIYKNDQGFTVKKSEKGFTFSFDKDWGSIVPARRLPLRDPVFFRLRIEFYCVGETACDAILISSDLETPEKANERKLSELRLLWGCLAEDTMVTMADGFGRRIDSISIGDMISTVGNGYYVMVKNIYSGYENEIWVLESENGHTIRATDQHPFLTEKRGMVAVRNLTGEDRILMEDGSYQSILGLYAVKYNGMVYNLELDKTDGGTLMLCNGFATGDFNAQNDTAVRFDNEDKPMSPALLKELEALKIYRDSLNSDECKRC